jgi:uncharacterized protein YuzE
MARVKIIHDREGKTLSVWFDNPEKEHVCEETGEEVLLIKDRQGKVIGFEKINYESDAVDEAGVEYSVA